MSARCRDIPFLSVRFVVAVYTCLQSSVSYFKILYFIQDGYILSFRALKKKKETKVVQMPYILTYYLKIAQ